MEHQGGIGTEAGKRRDLEAATDEVQSFLDDFGRALTAGDTQTVVSMWETPAFVIGDQDAQSVVSREQLELFFVGARDNYNARGITDTHPEIVRLEWATPQIAMVEVRWPHIDARGDEVGEEVSTYTLRRDRMGRLKLRMAVMHGATATH